jgi:hypothetical protein
MLCAFFAIFVSMSCGGEQAPTLEPTPTIAPTPSVAPSASEEPTDDEKKASSTDGKSTWEYQYELMCGCTFVRDPLTPEEIAAREAEAKAGAGEGRFIYIENRP